VGYGDIIPQNNVERFYALFALLIGALVFGYMLSSIGSLVAALDRQAALSEEKMDGIKEYMRWRKFPRELTVRIRRYYEYFYERKTAFDEASILDGLTPPLRLEVVHHILRETIGRIPLFKQTLDISFQLEIFPLFQPMSAVTRETVFSKGEPSHGLFFLLKGRAEAISAIESRVLYNVKAGQSFGESVLTGRRRASTIRAITPCEMYTVSRASLHELFNKRPREGRLMHAALLREHVRKEKMRALSLRMLMNKLAYNPTQEVIELIAALRLQLYWTKVTESISLEMMPMQGKGEVDEEKPRPLSEQILDQILVPLPASGTSALTSPVLNTLRNTSSKPGTAPSSPLRDAAKPSQQQNPFQQNPLSLKRVADLQADMKKLLTMVGDMQSQLGRGSSPRAPNGTAEALI
jgi:CRP-like cAMP-binding protein